MFTFLDITERRKIRHTPFTFGYSFRVLAMQIPG
jgi:hypothetical protein